MELANSKQLFRTTRAHSRYSRHRQCQGGPSARGYSAEISRTLQALRRNKFDARFARSASEAKEMVPAGSRVGVGDSVTLRQPGILEELGRRKGKKTPCAVTGKCNDCRSSDRICGVTVIMEKRPVHTDLSVILIDEDLGFGWDPAWDADRITRIEAAYHDNSWPFAMAGRSREPLARPRIDQNRID